tara:strand:- start:1723 stop:2622 length:900 start_codon:yes stop_codon:yes gene_type:complete
MSGEGMGKNSSNYFFFFHTFLWVFLPWSVIGIAALGSRIKLLWKSKFAYDPDNEFLTLGGIVLIFLIISFAQFKLPHYLNSIIPLVSVLTASYLYNLYAMDRKKSTKVLLGVQYFILALFFTASVLICFYVFKFDNVLNYVWKVILVLVVIYYSLRQESYFLRIISVSAMSAILLNAILNLHFYPSLLQYQAGSEMAKVVKSNAVQVDNIYKLSERYTWALDFYNQKPVHISSVEGIRDKRDIWVYATDVELRELRNSGLEWDLQYTKDQFRITRLQAKFLDATTRNKLLEKMHLVHLP